MELLTNSAKNIYQECPRKFQIMMEQGYRPVQVNENLSFGSLIHKLLELYLSGEKEKIPQTLSQEKDDFRRVTASALIDGYMLRWPDLSEVIGVEKEFKIPLVNPKTTAASRTFDLAGKIDCVLKTAIMEHKTTKDDISDPQADYWLKLTIDPQITGYFLGAESLGYKPEKIVYDVIGKPSIRPGKATPVEVRKYKKDGTLYASQRETDETPDEFALRLRADIAERPDRYYQRRDIVRTETDIIEYLQDMWSVGKLIMESRNEDFWPRRPSQCFNMGKCQYYPVCSKMAMLDDPSLYRKAETKNEELSLCF